MKLTIFEDEKWQNFLPLTYTRPSFDLKCGILKLRQKVEHYFPKTESTYLIRKELEEFYKERFPNKEVNSLQRGIHLFVNGRILIDDIIAQKLHQLPMNTALFHEDECVAFKTIIKVNGDFLPSDIKELLTQLSKEKTKIKTMHQIWELVDLNKDEILNDSKRILREKINHIVPDSSYHLVNLDEIFVGSNTEIEPNVLLDASDGPVIIDDGTTVMANTVIKGPTYIGKNCQVKIGAKIYEGVSVGKFSKIGGEIEETIIQSYSNKQHDGFLGHAYLGEWVNIGADTNNSDLKNNYKYVKAYDYPSKRFISTDLQFFGLIMGDHSKTGINTMFNTGCVVGVGCNLYSSELFSGFIPSFSWGKGSKLSDYKPNKILVTADIVKQRRGLFLSKNEEKILHNCYNSSKQLRKIFNGR